MCSGDDQSCPQFRQHRQELLEDLDSERRNFLKSAFVTGGGAAAWVTGNTLISPGASAPRTADLPLPIGYGRYGALGLFQQAAEAAA